LFIKKNRSQFFSIKQITIRNTYKIFRNRKNLKDVTRAHLKYFTNWCASALSPTTSFSIIKLFPFDIYTWRAWR